MATRREFLGSGVLTAAPEAWSIPQEVAGVKLPDSKLARDATDFTRGLSAPVVFNHVLRTSRLRSQTDRKASVPSEARTATGATHSAKFGEVYESDETGEE